MQILGTVSLLANSWGLMGSPFLLRKPILSPASTQIACSFCLSAVSRARSSRLSPAVLPKSAARTMTIGTATSTQEASMPPQRSTTLPVGSSLPVFDPTGLRKLSSTPGNLPSTPGISVSAGMNAVPSGVFTAASAVTRVLVLRILMVVLPEAGWHKPVSNAYNGNAADMLPQLTLQSIADLSAASCASVL